MGEASKLKRFFSRIEKFLLHNALFRWIVGLVFKMKIADLVIRKVENRDGTAERFKKGDEQHAAELKKLSGLLADDISRKTLDKVLEYRRTWKACTYRAGYCQTCCS